MQEYAKLEHAMRRSSTRLQPADLADLAGRPAGKFSRPENGEMGIRFLRGRGISAGRQ
jgi:hypothetical protein